MAALYALPQPDDRAVRAVNSEDTIVYDAGSQERIAPFVMADGEAFRTISVTLGPSHLSVYMNLCNRENDGVCWPSLDTLAEDCKVSRMTVTRVLNDLEAGGWVKREQRFNEFGMATSTQYKIVHIAGRLVKKRDDSGCNTTVTTHEHRVNIDPSNLLQELEENKNLTKTEPEEVVIPPSPPEPPKEKSKPTKRKHRMPDGFGLTPERTAYALSKGMSSSEADGLMEEMQGWAAASGGVYEDWNAAWQNWVRRRVNEWKARGRLAIPDKPQAEHPGGITDEFLDELRQKRLARQAGRQVDGPDVIPTTGYVLGGK